MKILITGSSGFIGSHIIKYFTTKHSIIPYDITEGKNILNNNQLKKELQKNNVDIVIHLAALLNQAESWKKPDEYFRTNVIGTYNVISSSIESNVKRVINFSSAAVYGKPLTPYGLSKKLAEKVCISNQNKLKIVTFRPFNIYGKHQDKSYNYVIHSFIKNISHNQPVNIYGDGNQTRDFFYINDLMGIIDKFISAQNIYSPVDIGSGNEITMNNLATLVAKILRKKLIINYLPIRNEPYRSKANTTKLIKMGINPKKFISLKKGINMLITP